MFSFGKKIGIDLGTTNILIYVEGEGVVLNEPSVVAMNKESGKILAIGREAREMLGRTPSAIVAIKPIEDGVIADYSIVENMLKFYIKKIHNKRIFFPPYLMICIPSGGTSIQKRAVRNAAIKVGCKKVFLIEESKAVAIGANLDITKPEGNMVIDVGGGTTDVAVLSMGDIVTAQTLRTGGNKQNEVVNRYLRKKYNLAVGEITTEEIKHNIGYAINPPKNEKMSIRGRDLLAGLPKTIEVTAEEISETLSGPLSSIIEGTKLVLEKTPPELAADIIEKGIFLAGGGSLLKNFPQLIEETTGITTHLADDPISCVAIGTGRALQHIDLLKKTYS